MSDSNEGKPSAAAAPAPTKPARPVFKRPAWAQPKAAGDAVGFFSRSKQSFQNIVAEQEEKRRQKLAREGKANLPQGDHDAERVGKRRRISTDADEASQKDATEREDDDDFESPRERESSRNIESSASPTVEPEEPKESLTKRYEKILKSIDKGGPAPAPAPAPVIDVEDYETDPATFPVPEPGSKETSQGPPVEVIPDDEDDPDASDEEFRELARKAREKARLKKLESEGRDASTQDAMSSGNLDPVLPSFTQHISPPPAPDPVVQILITSRIVNTRPLIVNRHLSQRLKDVRLAWCSRQGFDPETSTGVFLTWRGKRLFDITTCKSLDVKVTEDGTIIMKGDKYPYGEETKQIHMEAMTEEIFEEVKKAKEQGLDPAVGLEEEPLDEPPLEEKKVETFRLILNGGKGVEDFKLIVKPSTQIWRLIGAFKQTRDIPQEREVYLMFDGERLDPESRVGDTELADLDHIDVHIK